MAGRPRSPQHIVSVNDVMQPQVT